MEYQKLKTNTYIYSDYTKDGTGLIPAHVIRKFKAYNVQFADEKEPDEIFIPNSSHDGKEEVEPIILNLQGITSWYAEEQNDEEEEDEVVHSVQMEQEDRLDDNHFVELGFDIIDENKNKKKWYCGVVTKELDAFLINFYNEDKGKKDDEYAFLIQFPEEENTKLYLESGTQFRKVEYDENNEDHRKLTLRRFENNCALIDEQCEALEEELANCEYQKHLLNQRIALIESENSRFSQETFNDDKEKNLANKKETAENMKKSTERLVEAIDKGLVIKLDHQEKFMNFFNEFVENKKLDNCVLLQDSLSKYFKLDDTSEYKNIEYSHLKTCLHEEFLPTLLSHFLKANKKLEYIKFKKSYEKVKNISDRLEKNIMNQYGIKKEMENAISKELSARTKTNKKRCNPESDTPLLSSKKRGRGRPQRNAKTPSACKPAAISPNSSSSANKKKKRGRPRKDASLHSASKQPATNTKKRGRGRPRKDSSTPPPQQKRGRGRPRNKNSSPGEGLTNQQLSEAMHPHSPASVDTPSSAGTPFSLPVQTEGYQSDKSEDY